MYPTLLFENQPDELQELRLKIIKYCPCLEIAGQAETLAAAQPLFQGTKPDLVFLNPDFMSCTAVRQSVADAWSGTEIIYIAQSQKHTIEALQHRVFGYLFKPINEEGLISVVQEAVLRIREKEEQRKDKSLLEKLLNERKSDELIGIPTIEGYEFIFNHEIIRCEGLQKCTRVVTTSKKDIISSYNIGEFIKLLQPYNFFSPHKSYLINLAFIKKYKRDGTIILRDNSTVPISKRKKGEFLSLVVHL